MPVSTDSSEPATVSREPEVAAERGVSVVPVSRGLRVLAGALLVCTFVLVTSGGLVTSYNAGMAVPDWPSSFGRAWLLPVNLWSDLAIALEHNHRLTGQVTGLVTIALCKLAFVHYGRRHRLAWAAAALLGAIVVQGVFGGLRVQLETWFGAQGVYEPARVLRVVHGVTGQLVLGAVVVLAAALGPWATRQRAARLRGVTRAVSRVGRIGVLVFAGLIVVQLTLGATVRHYDAASAIPDVPLVYGGVFPPLNEVERAAAFERLGGGAWEVYAAEPAAGMEAGETGEAPAVLASAERVPATSPSTRLVLVHYAHRVGGMLVLPAALFAVLLVLAVDRSGAFGVDAMAVPISGLVLLFGMQVLLGMGVIASREEPWVASAHQAVGALLLAVTAWLAYRVWAAREVGDGAPGSAAGGLA